MRERARECQCGARPAWRPADGGPRRRGRPVPGGAELLECPACGNRTGGAKSREALLSDWNAAGWCGQGPARPEQAPFGDEWKGTLLRLRKEDLADLVRRVCLEKEALRGTVRRLRARLERTELQEVIERLTQRGVLTARKGGV